MSQEPEESTRPRRRRSWLLVLSVFVVAVLLGDMLYSTYVKMRYDAWEAQVERNEDGVRLGCEPYQLGKGPTAIILLHGINDSPACYREIAEDLAGRGYHCRAIRMPGFAEPLSEYARHADREIWVRSVREQLAAARESHEHVVLVAHSLGGAVAIRLLDESPDAADGLVLLAPAVDVASHRSPLLHPRTWHRVANYILLFTTFTESPFGLDAVKADHDSYPYQMPFTPRKVFDETFALIEENAEAAEQFDKPLLMVLSPDDIVIDNEAAKAFYERVNSENKSLVEIADTGHSLTVDHRWPEVATAIDRFIATHFADSKESSNQSQTEPAP